jgi:hypothetical protein
MEAILADWQAVAGGLHQPRAAWWRDSQGTSKPLRAEGIELSQKAIGLTIHQSTRCQRITA